MNQVEIAFIVGTSVLILFLFVLLFVILVRYSKRQVKEANQNLIEAQLDIQESANTREAIRKNNKVKNEKQKN